MRRKEVKEQRRKECHTKKEKKENEGSKPWVQREAMCKDPQVELFCL